MKTTKLIFLSYAIFLLGAASCSNEFSAGDEDIYEGPFTTNYLSVNIVSSGGANDTRGTRADNTTSDYRDGEGDENTINSVRFYFFTANGEAANVKHTSSNNTLVNYLDWQNPRASDSSDDPNIEKS